MGCIRQQPLTNVSERVILLTYVIVTTGGPRIIGAARSMINIRKIVPMTKKSQGFSIIELVIVLVVVLAAGAGGWYMWQKNQKSESTKQSEQRPNDQATTPSDPAEGGKYLVIKEWGVRFAVPEELRSEITYTLDPNKEGQVVIDSSKFPEGADCVSFGLARTPKKITNSIDPQGFDSSSMAKIGDFYYSRLTGIIACSNDETVHQNAAVVQKKLYHAATSIEATP